VVSDAVPSRSGHAQKLMKTAHILSLGAGVQSSVLALLSASGDERFPRLDAAIFADTQWEPKAVYEHLGWLEQQLPYPVVRVTKGDLKKAVETNTTGYGDDYCDIPNFFRHADGTVSMSNRRCTTHYKIRPIRRAVRSLMAELGAKRCVQHMGISLDEALRMRTSDVKYIDNSYPLIDAMMTRSDCLEWFSEHYPGRHLPRSACLGCPYHSNKEWLRLADESPEELEETDRVDAAMRESYRRQTGRDDPFVPYLHSSGRPLGEAIAALKAQGTLALEDSNGDMWEAECQGMCGV